MLVRINGDGFSNPGNSAIIYMEVHNDSLYAGTWNVSEGCMIYASEDGEDWTAVNTPGFGNKQNLSVVRMRSFNDYLYVGVWNLQTGAELWRARDPHKQSDWELVMANGLENNKKNQAVGAIRQFSDWLYIGTFNPDERPQVWRSRDGSPGSFERIVDGSFFPPETTDASILYVWKNSLYLGVESAAFQLYLADEVGGRTSAGCTVWRSDSAKEDDSHAWVQISPPGFGDSQNLNAFRLMGFKDHLYVGTWTRPGTKSAQIWRSPCEGNNLLSSWEMVNPDGFGDVSLDTVTAMEVFGNRLYVGGFSNLRYLRWMGFLPRPKGAAELSEGPRGFFFVTENGREWESISASGFLTDAPVEGVHSLCVYKGRLFVGLQSINGPCELWALD